MNFSMPFFYQVYSSDESLFVCHFYEVFDTFSVTVIPFLRMKREKLKKSFQILSTGKKYE